jgi:ATP-dependent protease HslVU (ClpYQ) peptidase subunit
MTCVIGLKRNGRVWIGADTTGIWDDGWGGIMSVGTSKVWKMDPFIFGSSGSYRAIQLVHRTLGMGKLLTTNRHRDSPITEGFMVRDLVPAIKKILEEGDFSEKKNERAEQQADFLIGVGKKLFMLQDDYAVLEIASPFTAIGSGKYVATGAMEILTQNTRLKPVDMINRALLAVQKHINTVGAPGEVMTTELGD